MLTTHSRPRLFGAPTGAVLCIALTAILLLATCSRHKPTAPAQNTDSTVHAPWEDEEAENFALEVSGQLAASRSLYDRIKKDLATIRTRWGSAIPTLETTTHQPYWQIGSIEVAVDSQLYAELRARESSWWDSLGTALQLSHAEFSDSALTVSLTFAPRLNSKRIGELYGAGTGVRWTKRFRSNNTPHGRPSVDGFQSGDTILYQFSQPPPYCADLCVRSRVWLFRATSAVIESVGYWGSEGIISNVEQMAWWPQAKLVRDQALDAAGGGEYPDRDSIPPSIVEDLEVTTDSSRNAALQWEAAGDDESRGVATSYELSVIGGESEQLSSGFMMPQREGTLEHWRVRGLRPGSFYYFVVRAWDEQGNSGGWSKRASATMPPPQPWHTYDVANGALPSNDVRMLAVDSNGNLWAATSGGASLYDGVLWQTFAAAEGIEGSAVRSLAVSTTGDLWSGTDNGSVCAFGSGAWTCYDSTAVGLGSHPIVSVEIDAHGDVWCCNAKSGVSHLVDGTWTVITAAQVNLGSNFVDDISLGPDGVLWFGTAGGLTSLDGANWFTRRMNNSTLGANFVTTVELRPGEIWCGHQDKFVGITAIRPTGTVYYRHFGVLPSTFVNAIAFDHAGFPWVGTTLGAYSGSLSKVLTSDSTGLVHDEIRDLVIDRHDVVWFATPRGISRYDPSEEP